MRSESLHHSRSATFSGTASITSRRAPVVLEARLSSSPRKDAARQSAGFSEKKKTPLSCPTARKGLSLVQRINHHPNGNNIVPKSVLYWTLQDGTADRIATTTGHCSALIQGAGPPRKPWKRSGKAASIFFYQQDPGYMGTRNGCHISPSFRRHASSVKIIARKRRQIRIFLSMLLQAFRIIAAGIGSSWCAIVTTKSPAALFNRHNSTVLTDYA